MESPGREYSLSQGLLEDPVMYPRVNFSALPSTVKHNKRSNINLLIPIAFWYYFCVIPELYGSDRLLSIHFRQFSEYCTASFNYQKFMLSSSCFKEKSCNINKQLI